jgi:hypothetical protein
MTVWNRNPKKKMQIVKLTSIGKNQLRLRKNFFGGKEFYVKSIDQFLMGAVFPGIPHFSTIPTKSNGLKHARAHQLSQKSFLFPMMVH